MKQFFASGMFKPWMFRGGLFAGIGALHDYGARPTGVPRPYAAADAAPPRPAESAATDRIARPYQANETIPRPTE